MAQDERIVGMDLLKLLSMFYVVVLHVLGQGGVLARATGAAFSTSWALEIWAYCAVDIFALVSGFVGYRDVRRGFSFERIARMWFQVFFWSMSINIVAWITHPDFFAMGRLIRSLLPVTTNRYWYFTSYVPVAIASPVINDAVREGDKKSLVRIAALLVVLMSGVSTLARDVDAFRLHSGYSCAWLALLYFVGAILKKYRVDREVSAGKAVLATAASFLATFGWKLGLGSFEVSAGGLTVNASSLVSYVSPTVLVMALCHVFLLARLELGGLARRVIEFLVPASFGVYLIHNHPTIFEYVLKDRFAFIADAGAPLVVPLALLCSFGIFFSCLCVEKARITVFQRIGAHQQREVRA